ncbi:PREDICTED: uncharacterized protein LOC105366431 [Ceratosolen solmsi marchali]|uniref:Uncharacterized protein LOC105366431 n=1 Tax=Ceratosolen solmsi marchali TaxID=326594 RepID=A0AAJ6YS43_9HYME|nr:PREDICTED: uncharacterized protein LOC105366431 [Ceratosolen solmsi marchali]
MRLYNGYRDTRDTTHRLHELASEFDYRIYLDMTLILIAHWLVIIVGIFCTQFAIVYPSPNQYNKNHYQIPQYELKNLRDKDAPLKNSLTSDLIIRKQMTERQPPLQATINKECTVEERRKK